MRQLYRYNGKPYDHLTICKEVPRCVREMYKKTKMGAPSPPNSHKKPLDMTIDYLVEYKDSRRVKFARRKPKKCATYLLLSCVLPCRPAL